ncbi:MAG: DNA translocase FtsK 4TM domain-containing protein, partial [Bacteroidia bacterium]|nr:DNA translocase FtsK 4TM domain-containing protein [Bacteroidia bacterium]
MAKKNNSFKSQNDFEREESQPASVSKGKFSWLRDERTRKIIGVFMILFTLFLLLSFISFLLNPFETDQDIVQSGSWEWLSTNHPQAISNLMGYIGAWFAHLFIHKWFGVSSFIILLTLFTIGTKALFNWQMYPMTKILRHSFFLIILFSLFFGLIFHSHHLFMRGSFGYHGFMWLQGLLGSIGAILALVLYAASYLVIVYNISFKPAKA